MEWFSKPKIYEQNKGENELVIETDYFSTLESVFEYRIQNSKPWDDTELLNNYYQLLHSMGELETQGIVHGNLNTDTIVYVYSERKSLRFYFLIVK